MMPPQKQAYIVSSKTPEVKMIHQHYYAPPSLVRLVDGVCSHSSALVRHCLDLIETPKSLTVAFVDPASTKQHKSTYSPASTALATTPEQKEYRTFPDQIPVLDEGPRRVFKGKTNGPQLHEGYK